MDIQLAKTFLEVMSAGSFVEAAKRLHVTQTTVTARVQTLERELGCTLFIRNRSGASLTQDGERFVEYAKKLLFTWHGAKLALSQPAQSVTRIMVGAENSLWNPLMVETVSELHKTAPSILIHAQVAQETALLQQLDQGLLDAILIHRPNYHSRFMVELLMEEKLIHVQSVKNPKPDLFVDWGAEFTAQYNAALPQPRQGGFETNLGPLGLLVLLNQGGNGYFRTRAVQKYLDSGELTRVAGAPEFSYPVYLLYGAHVASDALDTFIQTLKVQSRKLEYWSLKP